MSKRCRIFISYAHADQKSAKSTYEVGAGYPSVFLKYLNTSLPQLGGWIGKDEVFFDTKRLASEPEWSPVIERALSECDLFIFLVSPHSLDSEYCTVKELGRAVKRGVPVITVLLEPKEDWIDFPIRDPDVLSSPPLRKLGQFHSGGLPKESGNVKAVSLWLRETEAWNEVCKDITAFLKGPNFNTVQVAEVAPVSAPDPGTELQRMLWEQLVKHWPELARNPVFTGARVFQSLPKPLTERSVFDACAVSAVPTRLLAQLRGFVGKDADGRSTIARLAEQPNVLETVLRLTLVAAERYIDLKPGNPVVVSDEPVFDVATDPRVSAVLAAACFGFGIRLRSSSPIPENFIRPAAEEFLHEQGSNSIKRDLRAAANRFTLEFPPAQVSDEDVEDEELLQAFLDEARDKLGCQLVLLCHEQSPLRQQAVRETALGSLSVPVVFEGVPRSEVNSLLNKLKSAVKDLLDGLLGLPSTESSPPS